MSSLVEYLFLTKTVMSSHAPIINEIYSEKGTLSNYLDQELDSLLNMNFKFLEGKILTIIEAVLPALNQQKAAKDIVRDAFSEVRSSAYQYAESLVKEVASHIDEYKGFKTNPDTVLGYTYTRKKNDENA